MAGKTAVLSIRIIADGKQAGREFAETNKQVSAFDDGLRTAGVGAGIALAGIGALAIAAGNSASELQQATGAVESVYGAYAESVKKLASEAAENVGLAASEYSQLSSVIGSQLKNMGVPMREVAGQTDDLITLGADLAATFGGSTADAVAALASLLRGERDPIERYGVSIKQADINARLAREGLDELEGAARKSAETQTVLALLTEQTADASGQFAREIDTAAGAQQVATAKWEDAQAAIGEGLLPVMADLAGMLSEVATWVGDNTELVTIMAGVIGGLAGAILIANGAIAAYRTIATIATAAQIAWNVAMTANPIGIVVTAIGLLVAAIVALVTDWEEVGRVAGEVWANIIGWIEDAIGWVKDAIGWIGNLFGAADDAKGAVKEAAGAASSAAPATAEPATFAALAAPAAAYSASTLAVAEPEPGTGYSSWSASSRNVVQEGDTYNVTVNGAVDSDGTARTIEDLLNKRTRRSGRRPAFAGGDTQWR